MRISVRDLVVPAAAVAGPAATVDAALNGMLRANTDAIYIVDAGGRLVGVVTDSDFLRAELRGVAATTPVVSIAATSSYTANVDDDIASVYARLNDAPCGRIAVTDNGRFVGCLTRLDVLRLVRHLHLVASVTEVSAAARLAGPHFHRRRQRLAPVRKMSKATACAGRHKVRRLA